MALTKITYTNKETLNAQPGVAEKNKCTSDDLNEIKSVVNNAIDQVDDNTEDITEIMSNLSNIKDYSTNETRVGTWVDGKPLYRQVLHKTLSGAQNQVVGTINNVDLIILGGTSVIKYDSGGTNYYTGNPNSYEAANNWTKIYTMINRSTHTCNVYWNGSEAGEIWIECLYTKSTD
jgi:hypothetical protein